jgi:hypothetical protein
VTADHGYLWRTGVQTRRRATYSTAQELGPVPFFVKEPGQTRGRVSGAYARTLDVPSTIADAAGLRLGYDDDGRSAFSRAARRPQAIAFPTRELNATVSVPARRWKALRRAAVRRRLALFGSGDLTSLYTGIGPNRRLIGRDVSDLARAAAGPVSASVMRAEMYANVRRSSGVVPAQVLGVLNGGGSGRDLAVAVNGRVEAVGKSFRLAGEGTERFAFMVPEESLREGRNDVDVYEVLRGGRLRLLDGG